MDQATKQQTVESIVNTKDFGKLVQSAWSFMMEEVGMADLADVTASDDFMDQVNDEVNDLVARKHKGLSDSDHAKVVSAALKAGNRMIADKARETASILKATLKAVKF